MATVSGLLPAAAHAAPVPPELATKLLGKTIFLDPGHQGPQHGENLSRQVNDGRGGTKDCQTTGMVTANGIPEHTINWNVAQLVKSALEGLGAQVVLSRGDDSGWGGCVDDRARAAGASGAQVAVSIHADSAPPADHGFHFIVPALPIPDPAVHQAQSAAGLAATTVVRDAYLQAGFESANYAGVQNGLQTRADIAGPALSTVPTVFVEMGNGANPEDAAVLESDAGQLRHAMAITTGLASYLLGVPPGGTGSAAAPDAAALAQQLTAPTTARGVPESTPETMPLSQGYRVVPGTQTSPSTTQKPQSQRTSDCPSTGAAKTPGCPEPGAQSTPKSTPGTDTPGTGKQDSEQLDSGTLLSAGMQLLMPLIRSFGMDNSAITSELINLAYTLASTLLGPAK
ncbi:N-acetylmuramoyl-L-alanine amidase [Nocardia sp. NPDC048505]|uniref:N-acetylmuramoyl-L-alanine amidase n=1 Tax=unclassified Nocardia TaxID=2637762 RepID=UPI0033DDB36D